VSRVSVLGHRAFQTPPAEKSAFGALGEFLYAFKTLKLTESFRSGFFTVTDNGMLQVLDQLKDFLPRDAFDLFSHHAGTGLTDGAALAFKFDVTDAAVIVKTDVEINLITTAGIIAVNMDAAIGAELALISRGS
jgi:hypothetical protein